MSEQQTKQEQPVVTETQVIETTSETAALAERLAKLEREQAEQKSYATKLEQENATYRQIITDRGHQAPVQQAQPKATVSEIDREIDELERKASAGEITSDELAVRSLKLIRKAKDAGKAEAVSEVTNLYTQEQNINREFGSIFEDSDLKGLDKDLGDIAYGYMQAGVAQGMSLKQASEYAKLQTKNKLNAFRNRFGQSTPSAPATPAATPPKETPNVSSGLKGEGETNKQPPKKEEDVTPEASQKNWIEFRRSKMRG